MIMRLLKKIHISVYVISLMLLAVWASHEVKQASCNSYGEMMKTQSHYIYGDDCYLIHERKWLTKKQYENRNAKTYLENYFLTR